MEPKKIKIYDLDAMLHRDYQMEAFNYKQVAIFEGKNGIVVAEHEAVHQILESMDDIFEFGANQFPEPGHAWIIANFLASYSADELMKAPCKEMSMLEFFDRRTYNPRCMDNWKALLSSLQNIGFDLDGYLPEKKSLDQQMAKADANKSKSNAAIQQKQTERGAER